MSSTLASLNEVQLPAELPPIMITCFTRPDLLKEVISAIKKQTLLPSKIIVFVDGARNKQDKILTNQCIELFSEFSDRIDIEIIVRDKNLGCDLNVISAFNYIFTKYSSVVYLEDDVVPNIYFYECICRLLEVYKNIKKVFSVNGYETGSSLISESIKEDFFMSNRFFSWGFATWADRWHSLDIEKVKQSYNPFGKFYDIPLNQQTKLTMINQYYLEKTGKTDWVITVTLAALYLGYSHVVPKISFVRNIGFGHPESETYRGKEAQWVNCSYDDSFNPDKVPVNADMIESFKKPLTEVEIAKFLTNKNLYISINDAKKILQKYQGWQFKIILLKLILKQQFKRRFKT